MGGEKRQGKVIPIASCIANEPFRGQSAGNPAETAVFAVNRGSWATSVSIIVGMRQSRRGEKYTSADFVAHAGIPTLIDSKHAIAHSKVMVIDGATVITGSFNFTKAAEEKNAENLLVIRSTELAKQYTANWRKHADHSEQYEGKGMENPVEKPAKKRKAA